MSHEKNTLEILFQTKHTICLNKTIAISHLSVFPFLSLLHLFKLLQVSPQAPFTAYKKTGSIGSRCHFVSLVHKLTYLPMQHKR